MAEYKLSEAIIALSISKYWDAAKKEWDLYDIYLTDDTETCSCGHYPIKEICVLKNKLNGNQTIVGNECVKKFLGPSLYKIFQSFKNLNKDNTKALNLEAIGDHCEVSVVS